MKGLALERTSALPSLRAGRKRGGWVPAPGAACSLGQVRGPCKKLLHSQSERQRLWIERRRHFVHVEDEFAKSSNMLS